MTSIDRSAVCRLTTLIGNRDDSWDATAADMVSQVPDSLLDELTRNHGLLEEAIPTSGGPVDNTAFPIVRQFAADMLKERLDSGLGFVVLRGIGPDNFPPPMLENIFWRLCNGLGKPLAQKANGTMFGRVADLNLPGSARPRYHETGVGGSIHTDSPIMPAVADLVGLLCLQVATFGGESKFVSVGRVHDILLTNAAELLAELYEPFHFDRRIDGQDVSQDNPALLLAPIFSYDPACGERGLRLRWQPEYVWDAPKLPGVPPLSERRQLALHLLQGLLEDRSEVLTLKVLMQPGDMQFLNNHTVAHGRTPFADAPLDGGSSPAPPSRREMRRVWLRRRR